MKMRDATLSEAARLQAEASELDVPFGMDEDTFRGFYERTARALWAYLARVTGDPHLADDLLQEVYYRFLRAGAACDGEAHRRHYLFRIATNLARDGQRRRRTAPATLAADGAEAENAAGPDEGERAERRTDLARAMARLTPRERALLWLAYAHGSTHREIADTLDVKTGSVKLLLFRARRKAAALLRGSRVHGVHGIRRTGSEVSRGDD